MPFRLTVSAMEVGFRFDASTTFPELTIAPMGSRALMLQIRTMERSVHHRLAELFDEDSTTAAPEGLTNEFPISGIILTLRYDTRRRPLRHNTQPPTTAIPTITPVPVSLPKPRLHVVHSGASLYRPRRALPVSSTPLSTSRIITRLTPHLGGVCTLPIIRNLKRRREFDDVGGSQESNGMLRWLLLCHQTKRRLL